mgnify:CR=1 FL=1
MRAFSGSFFILLLASGSVLALDVTFGSELQEQGLVSISTEDGGFLTSGMSVLDVSRSIVSSEGPGGLDCMLIRWDSEGNVLWAEEYYSGPWLDLAVAGVPCDDGDFVFAGVTTTMEEGQNNWLFRVDPQGQLVWETSPGTDFDDWTYDLAATDDGGYVLAGYVDSLSGSGSVLCLLKTDGSGNEIWNRQYGGYGSGKAEAVLTTEAGELLVNGYTESGEKGMSVPFLMRTTEDGDVIWFENFQGMDGHCYSLDMSVLGDGNIMMAGYGETGNGDYDVWVGKASTEGEILGEWTFGGSGDDMAFSTCPCPRGIVIAGSTDSAPAERTDLLLMALSPSGDELWWVNHGGPGNEGAEHIGWIPSGGFLVSGYTSSAGEGETDIWVLKVDCEGQPM